MTPTPEQIADDLDAAADILITDGWCQNGFSDDEGRVCALGAIGRATLGDAYPFLVDKPADQRERYYVACWEISEQVPHHNHVPIWNDDPKRTEDDVHDLLRDTAKQLREQGA